MIGSMAGNFGGAAPYGAWGREVARSNPCAPWPACAVGQAPRLRAYGETDIFGGDGTLVDTSSVDNSLVNRTGAYSSQSLQRNDKASAEDIAGILTGSAGILSGLSSIMFGRSRNAAAALAAEAQITHEQALMLAAQQANQERMVYIGLGVGGVIVVGVLAVLMSSGGSKRNPSKRNPSRKRNRRRSR